MKKFEQIGLYFNRVFLYLIINGPPHAGNMLGTCSPKRSSSDQEPHASRRTTA
jgi:hypothetical protein